MQSAENWYGTDGSSRWTVGDIGAHPTGSLIADENYFGIRRTQECVFIQLTLNAGRTVDQKKAFYRLVAEELNSRLGLRMEGRFYQPP